MRNIVKQHCLKQSKTCNIVAMKQWYILFPKNRSNALKLRNSDIKRGKLKGHNKVKINSEVFSVLDKC